MSQKRELMSCDVAITAGKELREIAKSGENEEGFRLCRPLLKIKVGTDA